MGGLATQATDSEQAYVMNNPHIHARLLAKNDRVPAAS